MKTLKKYVAVVVAVLSIAMAIPMQADAKVTGYAKNTVEAQIMAGINAERANAGLSALAYDADMEVGADLRASEVTKKWSHVRPDGTEYWTADEDHIYGENLSKDYSSVNDMIAGWMASPAHRDNILFEDFGTCAVGVLKAHDGTYVVALEFGY